MTLPEIDPLILVVLCGLCGVGLVAVFLFQFLGGVLDLIFGLFGVFGNLFEAGPFAGCGCLAVLGGCGLCGGLIFLIAQVTTTCGTPEAVNFCRFF
ncbi:MAG: hypothetical protein OHK0046_07520 [Anaerolineae bacterium]